jgi:c-di-GMP phosphodiesterase
MLFSQTGLAKYRYYRLALAGAMGLLTLILTLGIRIYEQSRVISADQQRVAMHTVEKLENSLNRLPRPREKHPLTLRSPVVNYKPAMQQTVARMQTLRSITLVTNGTITCSSLIGALDLSFSKTLPDIAQGRTRLEASRSKIKQVRYSYFAALATCHG